MGKINQNFLNAISRGDLINLKNQINRHGLHHSVEHGYVLLLKSIKNKDNKITKLLLDEGSRVNRKEMLLSDAPLHIAIQNGDLEIIKMLLHHGADINAYNEIGLSPLILAISMKNEKIVNLLLKRKPNLRRCIAGITPLHAAVINGSFQITEKLLNIGARVDLYSIAHVNRFTPLRYVGAIENLPILKFICHKKATKLTPLHMACKNGNIGIIELLLNNNADINARENNSFTPLYLAVENSHREAFKLLMDHGAKIDDVFENGKTILSCAVDMGLSMIVQDILQYRPDINHEINKKSFKNAALKPCSVYPAIIENLLKYGFSFGPDDINDTALLHNAIQMGYTEIIKNLIKHGLDLTCNTEENRIILHIAEKHKQLEVAKLLLTHGADVNATDKTGKPPIYYSTQNSDVNMTKLLLLHGAEVKKYPKLLRIATNKVCKEIVEILLENKVDIEARDKFGRAALHLTASYDQFLGLFQLDEYPEIINNKTEIAKMLLNSGAKINATTFPDGLTALHIACEKEFINVVKVLLDYQAGVEYVAKGCKPLHIAAQTGNATIIGMLLDKRANINAKQTEGYTALHITADLGHTEALKILLKNGAAVYLKNNTGDMPLHLASKTPNSVIVSILIKHMSHIDFKNSDGNTPLHVAIMFERADVIDILLNFGSDINILGKNNNTAIDLAHSLLYKARSYYLGDMFDHLECDDYKTYNIPNESSIIYILRILLLHAITLNAANLYNGKKDLYSYLDDDDSNCFLKIKEDECKNEIDDLKYDKIENSKLSFYNILTYSIHSLTSYTRNKDVMRAFESDCYKTKYPIYGNIIERNFKKATQRRPLLERANEFFQCNFQITYECADQILSYLNIVDLENIINLW